MADVVAETAFLASMRDADENAGGYRDDAVDGGGAQIDSSDEYDPAQNVQDISLSGPQISQISLPFDSSNLVSHPPPTLDITAPSDDTTPEQENGSMQLAAATSSEGMPNPPVPTSLEDTERSATSTKAQAALTSPTSAVPKARLPHDRIGMLEDRIREDEKGDVDAWLSLIDEHKRRGKLGDARKVYDRFFAVFPSAVDMWISLANLESETGNRQAVEAIFSKTLPRLPSHAWWSRYLSHIRRYYNIATDKTGQASQTVHAAYEAVLGAVGIDKDAGPLWQDYIQFIKSGPGIIGGTSWQDQQKMDVLRKAYTRAICIPNQCVESIWKEYSNFEMGLNKLTGRKFLQEKSPDYMTARSSYIELQNITRDLRRTTLPVLPPALGFDGDVEYIQQVDIWRRWIDWEKADPLVLKDSSVTAYRGRIVYVYKQALMALRFWPEMWSSAAEFCFDNELESQGNEFLAQGTVANPESCLLAFRRADRLELTTTNGSDDESKRARGLKVREPYATLLDALYALITKAMTREARDIARLEAGSVDTPTDGAVNEIRDDRYGEDNDEDQQANASERRRQERINSVKALSAVQIGILNKTITHAWIALMRSMQRMQGTGKPNGLIGGSRQVLTDARKRGRLTSDIYVAAAMLEFHCGDGETSKRIFEKAIKLYPEDEKFALAYIKFMINTNDIKNARVIFRTTVDKLEKKADTVAKAKPLYAFYHDYEVCYGELTSIIELEKRMKMLFPDDPQLSSFSQRFANDGFNATAVRPLISPAQIRSKVQTSIEAAPSSAQPTPPGRFVQPVDSPKRPLPVEIVDSDGERPRKFVRADSPLKGAAGRRLNQQNSSRHPLAATPMEAAGGTNLLPPPPPPLPRDVLFLLSIIPNASTYTATRFSAEAMVGLLQKTHVPSYAEWNQRRQYAPPPLQR